MLAIQQGWLPGVCVTTLQQDETATYKPHQHATHLPPPRGGEGYLAPPLNPGEPSLPTMPTPQLVQYTSKPPAHGHLQLGLRVSAWVSTRVLLLSHVSNVTSTLPTCRHRGVVRGT
jgi:hypothetical protein